MALSKHIPVSIVIALYNAERLIGRVLEAIFTQDYPSDIEVIVVNDGSTDGSLNEVKKFADRGNLTIIDQPNQGPVIATNNGFRTAKHDIICSVDCDVVLHKDWLRKVVEEFEDDGVGAVQGYFKTPNDVTLLARLMGYDVEARYDSINTRYVTHVCTGNTAYRREAIEKVGLFDPRFKCGYAYDSDMSYRLQKAGYRLVFLKDAISEHYWKADLKGYIKQQYLSAYGRMQLIEKHPDRIMGDTTSGARMILQVPLTIVFLTLLFLGCMGYILSLESVARSLLTGSSLVLGLIMLDRSLFALKVFKKQKDPFCLLMPFLHLLRNIVWGMASINWALKRFILRRRDYI